ncbi:MAG: hypothetical protein M3020_24610 [Myxococcota bacterium]|nr:hypothetical protein [Myxococcota bacterium]
MAALLAGAIAWAALLHFSPSRAVLESLEAAVRSRGGVLHVDEVRRGVLEDVVLGARIELGDGTALIAPEARVVRRASGAPEIRVREARVELHRDPLAAYSGFRTLEGAVPEGLAVERTSLVYEHRSVGRLSLDGVRRVAGAGPDSFAAERARLGPVTWPNPMFTLNAKDRALEVLLGPRATARYLASDGRAAEWLVQLPRQTFGREPARFTATFSWIVPDDPALERRGSFRVILDQWPAPAWPEATALLGNSGAIAAPVTLSPEPSTLRLERLKLETAHFSLDGSGTVTLTEPPRLELEAKGRRACTDLLRTLPGSRYRDAIAAYGPREGESVELSLHLELSLRDSLEPHMDWRLSAGCGLAAQ